MKDVLTKVEKKRTRVPVSDQRDQMTVRGLDTENFVYRWVNDVGDRIPKFLLAGYNFIKADDKVHVGETQIDWTKPQFSLVHRGVGGGVQAYLMGIPKEWYEEDQRSKDAKIDEAEKAMYQAAQSIGYGKISSERKSNK